MNQPLSRLIYCTIAIAAFWFAIPAEGSVMVQNGDFETPDGSGFIQEIDGWGESNAGTFDDFLISGSDFYGALDGGQTAGFNTTGYIYQEIGTPDGFDLLRVEGVNYWRDNWEDQHGELTVQIYSLISTHSFVFAELGNDIADVGTLLGSRIIDDPQARGETVSFSEEFDLTGLSGDSRLFLRFTVGPNVSRYAYVDNVSASLTNASTSAVPEPTSLALLGLGSIGLAGGAWRKRRKALPA